MFPMRPSKLVRRIVALVMGGLLCGPGGPPLGCCGPGTIENATTTENSHACVSEVGLSGPVLNLDVPCE